MLHTSNTCVLNMYLIAAEGFFLLQKQSEKPSTCKCSRDVVFDLDVHKESGQSERHVALAAQADVMKTCRA